MKKAICFLVVSAAILFTAGAVSAQESREGYTKYTIDGQEFWVKNRTRPSSSLDSQRPVSSPTITSTRPTSSSSSQATVPPAAQSDTQANDVADREDVRLVTRGLQRKESEDFIRQRLNQYPTVRVISGPARKTVEVSSEVRLAESWYGEDRRQNLQNRAVRGATLIVDRLLARRAGVAGREARGILRDESRSYEDPSRFQYQRFVVRSEIRYFNNETHRLERTLVEAQEFILRFRRTAYGQRVVEVYSGDVSSVVPGKNPNLDNNFKDVMSLATFMWTLDPRNPANDPNSPEYGANKIPGGVQR